MKKKILFLSILCLLFVTLSYTYSSFNNTIVGTITANVKDWVFKVSVDNGTIKDGGYNLHLSGTSGSFNVNINTTGSKSGADYTIELIGDSSIKFYTDSSYTKLISNNIYGGSINSNTSSSVTMYYKSDTAINSDILIKTKGTIMEIATMKNGQIDDESANGGTEFWNNNYKPYIRTITFGNDLSNLPSTCTEDNLCWDISESQTQKKKVYGYLVDTGLKDSTDNTKPLYNLYIVSENQIFSPNDSSYIFSFYNKYISNLISINFNNNFNTSNVTKMDSMFYYCSSLTSLDLSNFNTANVTQMNSMFSYCKSLTSLNLSSFNTANVINMDSIFENCLKLTSLDLSSFNTANVTNMDSMFDDCSKLTSLDISNFDTSNVTNMRGMFFGSSLTSLDLSSFNTVNVTNMSLMFSYCQSLTTLDLSNFNTANVTNMDNMFSYSKSLTSLNLSSFNTANVLNMSYMFSDCSSLTSLDLSNFNTSNVTDMSGMFGWCLSLTSLDLSSFNTANVTTMKHMFNRCYKLQTEITITGTSITNYANMFSNALTDANAYVIINYSSEAESIAQGMKSTAPTSNQSKITLKQI